MNTKEKQNKMNESIIKSASDMTILNSFKTIFIVKYSENSYMPDAKLMRKNTYNLFAFEDFEEAKEYMNLAHNNIVMPYVKKGDFRIMLNTDVDKVTQEDGITILYKKCTKLIGDNDRHKAQTKLFTFTIETINLKYKKS